ncbi:MAG TPA: UrcA family protein [Steroidobacteraceae bacterium]|nr:UrcA family protein [Steroidobacteraceae bacterium]
MSVSRLVHRSLIAAAIGAMTTAAVAQQLPEVKVVANKPVLAQGRTASGHPVEVIQLSRVVNYADINVASHVGAKVLQQRVSDAAKAVCDELATLYPTGTSHELGTGSCVTDTVNATAPQVQAAIAAAEKTTRFAEAPR